MNLHYRLFRSKIAESLLHYTCFLINYKMESLKINHDKMKTYTRFCMHALTMLKSTSDSAAILATCLNPSIYPRIYGGKELKVKNVNLLRKILVHVFLHSHIHINAHYHWDMMYHQIRLVKQINVK